MNFMKPFFIFFLLVGIVRGQEPAKAPSAAIEGIKGVKQEAVESVKKVEPPTTLPVPPPAVQGVQKVDGVKTPATPTPPPPPPPPVGTVPPNTVDGVKTPAPNSVQGVPPPPVANAVSTIRAVQGVEGIAVPKQRNLEAALQIKAGATPDPKGKAAAAALFGRGGKNPVPAEEGDGRAALQEFEKQTTPGS